MDPLAATRMAWTERPVALAELAALFPQQPLLASSLAESDAWTLEAVAVAQIERQQIEATVRLEQEAEHRG